MLLVIWPTSTSLRYAVTAWHDVASTVPHTQLATPAAKTDERSFAGGFAH
jgi:hypothetical protein